MNVCIIYSDFPTVGGVGDYVYFIGKELAKNVDLHIITSKYVKFNDLNVHHLFSSILGNVKEYLDLFKLLKKLSPDIIDFQYTGYSYGWYDFKFLLFLALLRITLHSQIVITFHEFCDPIFSTFKNFLISIVQRIKIPFLLILCHKIIVTTNWRYNTIKKLFFYKKQFVFQILMCSNIPFVKIEDNTIREKYKIDKDCVVFSIFGSVNGDRNYELIFKAIKMIENENIKLFIIGKINYDKRYNELKDLENKLGIKDKIIWTDFLDRRTVSLYLSASDIYLLPIKGGLSGRQGTFPPALEHGLPVITTRGKDTQNFLINNKNVIFTPDNNVEELAKNMKKMIYSKELRKSISDGGKEIFTRYYSLEKLSKKILNIYSK